MPELETPEGAPTPDPATSPAPADVVTLSKAEHDRIQAENRRLRKESQARQDAESKARQDKEIAERAARSDFDAALSVARGQNAELQNELQRLRAADAIRDEIARRGFAGSKASALRRLCRQIEFGSDGSPTEESVKAAIEGTIQDYPDLFGQPGAGESEEPNQPAVRRGPGPSNPPPPSRTPDGYLSPEEYQSLPPHIRTSREIQARVEKSRPLWPGFDQRKKILASTFG